MPKVSNLTDHTGYWLRCVSNAVSHEFARRVIAEGVTVAEWVFLRAAYDSDEVSPSALADQMGMTRGAISKLSDRLMDKGLITREDHPTDKRAHTLSLTNEGRRLVPRLAKIADQTDTELFAVLTTDERAALDTIMKAFVERSGMTSVPID